MSRLRVSKPQCSRLVNRDVSLSTVYIWGPKWAPSDCAHENRNTHNSELAADIYRSGCHYPDTTHEEADYAFASTVNAIKSLDPAPENAS